MDRAEILRQAAEVAELPQPAEVSFRGKTFYVARINGAMRDAMATFKARLEKQGIDSFRESDLAAMGWCDAAGTAVFSDIAEGSALLARWDGELQQALAQKFVEVNNLNGEAAEKNSEASQN